MQKLGSTTNATVDKKDVENNLKLGESGNMEPRDKYYLSLQFKNKIHTKNGSEFQSFFESIMEKCYQDFQKIKPYGKDGDGGNDGYRKKAGVYYQVYSPNCPKIMQSEAADKLTKDFKKLKDCWDQIATIKEYRFVFNDKYEGSSIKIESALSELKSKNNNLQFDVFLAKNLEEVFFNLQESDILRAYP